MAAVGTTTSNIKTLTVYGITIYTDKTVYSPGERLYGAVSGTYTGYHVHIFYKNSSDYLWTYTGKTYRTDTLGLVRWGTAFSDPIATTQSGRVFDLIGILSPDDPSGNFIDNIFEYYESYTIPLTLLTD